MHRTQVRRLSATGGAVAAAGLLLAATAGPAAADTQVDEPSTFTSAFTVMATDDMIINPDGDPVPGQDGATGTFDLRINSDEEIICYDITLKGVTGEFKSPAKTATHVHSAPEGKPGPPRIAFPNPQGDGATRNSSGCLKGPFTTGIQANGADTGEGFSLADIEADPAAFAADTHTADFTAGAVRGQLTKMPLGGVDTGAGGTADDGSGVGAVMAAGTAAVAGAGVLGLLAVRRRRVVQGA